jgi:integrase
MQSSKRKNSSNRKTPTVRIARPEGRHFQLRYRCLEDGREIRVSIGSRDEEEAQRLRRELEAKLVLGMDTSLTSKRVTGPEMLWEEFREEYRGIHLNTLRTSSAVHAESRLDLAERLARPKILGALAEPITLQRLQAAFLAGDGSRRKKPRSPHTVRGYMNAVLAALNWAHLQGWLPNAPKVQKLKTSKLKAMKGRPISSSEFQTMLESTSKVVGDAVSESWKHVLRGLWASALRLDELMHVSWDTPGTIRPIWKKGRLPILEIPAAMQKNDTEESIPLLPWFEEVLLETPESHRKGWVFNPCSLQIRFGRKSANQRPSAEWVGKIIGRIGKESGIEVEPANERTGTPIKHATAHDLRRSCGERLRDAGVPPLVICRVMRHSSWETTRKHYAPGNIQNDAEVLRSILGTMTSEK